jgi:DNA-binding transcriptional LysR family regulator
VAVAEELHFTRAAERIYVSQPALSKQIKMLERQAGAELFTRDNQGVRLTPGGKALLPHARRVLEERDEAWRAVERAKDRQRATLTVGMSTSPARAGMLPAARDGRASPGPRLRTRLPPDRRHRRSLAELTIVWMA